MDTGEGKPHIGFPLPSRITFAVSNVSEAVQWEQVGRLESELRAYDIVSIGQGEQQMVFPAGRKKLVEWFMAQVHVGCWCSINPTAT